MGCGGSGDKPPSQRAQPKARAKSPAPGWDPAADPRLRRAAYYLGEQAVRTLRCQEGAEQTIGPEQLPGGAAGILRAWYGAPGRLWQADGCDVTEIATQLAESGAWLEASPRLFGDPAYGQAKELVVDVYPGTMTIPESELDRLYQLAAAGDLEGLRQAERQQHGGNRTRPAELQRSKDGRTLLHEAAICCHGETLRYLIESSRDSGQLANAVDQNGRSALHLLLGQHAGGDRKVTMAVGALLQAGCDPGLQDDVGFSALHWAAMAKRGYDNMQECQVLLAMLLDAGADKAATDKVRPPPGLGLYVEQAAYQQDGKAFPGKTAVQYAAHIPRQCRQIPSLRLGRSVFVCAAECPVRMLMADPGRSGLYMNLVTSADVADELAAELEAEMIVAQRVNPVNCLDEYRVQFKGYNSNYNCWCSIEELQFYPGLLDAYLSTSAT